MTPNARYAAAIEILDEILTGASAEQVLTHWARSHRFAGSKDRAAIRDICFDIMRRRCEAEALGGSLTGRGLAIGYLRLMENDPESVFTGEGYAPSTLTDVELANEGLLADWTKLNLPDWMQKFVAEGDEPEFLAQNSRAPVFLRVNIKKSDFDQAIAALRKEDVETRVHSEVSGCLEVISGERRIAQSRAYQQGLVELQDAGSQAVVAALDLPNEPDAKILDYCAGGGGKTLHMAALSQAQIHAHDAYVARMKDIPVRAKRAGAKVHIFQEHKDASDYDFILVDAPCSGSGAWRRNPDGKWKLTEAGLQETVILQSEILNKVLSFTHARTRIGYVTCSLLDVENYAQIQGFLKAHPKWTIEKEGRFLPSMGMDGFYYCQLAQESF